MCPKARRRWQCLHEGYLGVKYGKIDAFALDRHAGVEAFEQRQFLMEKQIYDIQLVLEELLINKLLPKQGDPVDTAVTVGYSEESSAVELTITYTGEPCNPFEDGDDVDFSMLITRKLVKSNAHSWDGEENRLKLVLR